MSAWREMLMVVIKLADKVSTLNRNVDKRVVRIETALEFSSKGNPLKIIDHSDKDD